MFCADGNHAHARIAISAGWEYGCRLPAKGILPGEKLAFADQDWRKPNRARYMAELNRHRPDIATVLDWEHEEQLPEVLSWAEEASQYVQTAILIVPKVPGAVPLLPRRINGKDVWLAYSVPTSYGGSPLGLWELTGWPVHLLGGSPQKQMEIWRYLRGVARVVSADGNMAKKMATSRCLHWTATRTHHGHWQPLGGHDGNGHEEALRRSLQAIHDAWQTMASLPPPCST